MSTFVSVGNATQPFTRLLKIVCELSPQLPKPVFVQFGSARSFVCSGCTCVDFIEMEEFARRVNEAKLLIIHAGAGSVIHAVRAGKKPIVMPRRSSLGEIVNDHQLEFAREMERQNKVLVAHDAATLAQAVASVLQYQHLLSETQVSEPPLVDRIRQIFTHISIEENSTCSF